MTDRLEWKKQWKQASNLRLPGRYAAESTSVPQQRPILFQINKEGVHLGDLSLG